MQDRNNQQERTDRGKPADRSSRRKLLKAGVFFVPAIVTLHARAAFGQGAVLNRDYATTNYQYGTFQGQDTFSVAVHGTEGTWTPVDSETWHFEGTTDHTYDGDYTFKN